MTPYQIVTPLLSLLAIVYAWNLALREKKTIWEAVLWTLFWGGIASIALQPRILTHLSTLTGIRDQVNAIFVTSIGILFFLAFYMIIRIEELHQRQTRMIREMALREAGIGPASSGGTTPRQGRTGEERQKGQEGVSSKA